MKELQEPGAYACEYSESCAIRILIHTGLVALGTHPTRQREGAATLLLQWALDLAESKGMITILEAGKTAVSYGLYKKRGFRSVDKYTYVDKEKFPHAEAVYLETMIRYPTVKLRDVELADIEVTQSHS